jgi:hypothetical protein
MKLPFQHHYVKTSNRSRGICNGPLTLVTSVTVVVWHSLPIGAPGRPPGWPPQRPLPIRTSSNGLLQRPLHKFFVTDVKRTRYKCPLPIKALSVTGFLSPLLIAALLVTGYKVRYR